MRTVRVIIFLFSILSLLRGEIRSTSKPGPGESTSPADIASSTLAADRCDHLIEQDVSLADGRANYAQVSPGDIVCIEASIRNHLILRNFSGTAQKPITFINSGGRVVIASTSSSGLAIRNSRHFRLTGTGSSDPYGFRIIASTEGGLYIGQKSSDFEIDHLEIANVPQVGILSINAATCSDGSTNGYDFDGDGRIKGDLDDLLSRANFTQTNTIYHHNFIHNVGTEGIYLGSSFYSKEKQIVCASGSETRYDPLLAGVQLFDNRIEHTGWDGIQVGSATDDCHIHHNQVHRSGQVQDVHQRSGIMNNLGSVCNIYNNSIKDGLGTGIFIQGNGNNRVHDNEIVNAGQSGISVVTGSNPGNSIYVLGNTIITPKKYGIAYSNSKGTDNKIQNNLIVAPGNYATMGNKAYIRIWRQGNVTVSHNIFR